MTPLVLAIIVIMVSVGPLVIAVLLWLDHREERRRCGSGIGRRRHRHVGGVDRHGYQSETKGDRNEPRDRPGVGRASEAHASAVRSHRAPFRHRHSAGGACKSFPDRRVRRGRSSEAVRRPAPWHRQVDRSRAVPAPSGRTPCPLHGRFTSAGASAGEFGCVLRWVCRAQEEDDSGPSFTRASPSLTNLTSRV